MSRALSKANVPVSDFSAIEDNWKKVIPNLVHMLGDVCSQDNSVLTVNFGEYTMLIVTTNQKGSMLNPQWLSGVSRESFMVDVKAIL